MDLGKFGFNHFLNFSESIVSFRKHTYKSIIGYIGVSLGIDAFCVGNIFFIKISENQAMVQNICFQNNK